MKFKLTPINEWQDLEPIVASKKTLIFRGQSDSTWSLKSSLERALEHYDKPISAGPKFEREAVREFKRRHHHYSAYSPHPDDLLEWLSLMQHHSAPTRLLDWTYSLYVGLYFALHGASRATGSSVALWAIDREWAIDASARKAENAGQSKGAKWIRGLSGDERADRDRFRDLFSPTGPHALRFVAPMNPFRLNERLTVQKGVFLCPGDIGASFEENLQSLKGVKDQLTKYIIPGEAQLEFLRRLDSMNVNHASLFPGLDGFAKSLAVHNPVLAR